MIDRIREEYMFCRQNPRDYVEVGLVGNNITQWRANIVGPVGSPYENGLFILSIKFPETYPTTPPEIKFQTRIYHPNVSNKGDVSISVLKTQWNPTLSMGTIFIYLVGLLVNPNGSSPLRGDLCRKCLEDNQEFLRKPEHLFYNMPM